MAYYIIAMHISSIMNKNQAIIIFVPCMRVISQKMHVHINVLQKTMSIIYQCIVIMDECHVL